MNRLLLVLLLAGCGGGYDSTDDNHGYGYSYDAIAPDGLRVRYANDNPPRLAKIDALYLETANCMDLNPAPSGPLVVIEDNLVAKIGRDGIFMEPALIRIDSQITTFENQSMMPPYIFKHEMVHYLLYTSIGDADSDHHSPFFDSCGH